MKSRGGVTLMEMVIYLAILSGLLVVFVQLFSLLVNRQLETESLSSTQYDSSYLYSRFGYDFARAVSIEVPTVPGSSSALLRLTMPSRIVDYQLTGGSLQRIDNGNAETLNSSESVISALRFSRYGPGGDGDTVRIQMDITSRTRTQSGKDTIHFSSIYGLWDK